MGEHTARLAWIWLRITLVIAVIVGVIVLAYGWASGPANLALTLGALADFLVTRALVREWCFLASGEWWWNL